MKLQWVLPPRAE